MPWWWPLWGWRALTDGQHKRLEQLGIVPLPPAPEVEASAKPSTPPGLWPKAVKLASLFRFAWLSWPDGGVSI